MLHLQVMHSDVEGGLALERGGGMEIDKADEAVLALLRLSLRDGRRAWKGFGWEALGRLHRKG
jgi:hypothetical protein